MKRLGGLTIMILLFKLGCGEMAKDIVLADRSGEIIGPVIAVTGGLVNVLSDDGFILAVHMVTGRLVDCPINGYTKAGCRGEAVARIESPLQLNPVSMVCQDQQGRLLRPLGSKLKPTTAKSYQRLNLDGSRECVDHEKERTYNGQVFTYLKSSTIKNHYPAPLELRNSSE